jgi:hypothetical protein
VVADDITDRQLEAFRKFLDLLPHGKDADLVLLKGHLLIEEQLRLLIDQRLRNPTALPDARLECHQCICLAQSFFPPNHELWLWQALKKLNKIRNDIAHQIQPKGLQDRIEDFITSVQSGFHDYPDKTVRFEFTLWSLFTAVSDLVDLPIPKVVPFDPNANP